MEIETKIDPTWLVNFKVRAEAVGAKVHPAAGMNRAAEVIAELAAAKGQPRIAVAPSHLDLPDQDWQTLLGDLKSKLTIETPDTAGEIAALQVGLSYADLAVMETGSLVFATNDLAARMVAMLTYIHIAVVPASRMVEGLDQVGEQLQRWQGGGGDRRYISMVTGPSRTADIERVLTIGVQGPQELHIVLVG
jgi:L-lactate dehydrogenase complex protein LldG